MARKTPEREFSGPRPLPLNRLLLVVAMMGSVVAANRPAAAQNYPWCANFADGAGTNCGFSTQAQCMITVAGSGGYCAANNLYKPPVSPAPARHPVKRRAAPPPIKN